MSLDCPSDHNGHYAFPWSSIFFGECIYTVQDLIAILLGYLSVFFWILAQLPQLYTNWKLCNVSSLSPAFLAIWFLGDFSNLLGCILTHQLPFQIYLATWFVIIDIILLGQFIYYSLINPGPAVLHISTTLEDENCPLLIEGNDSNKSEIMKNSTTQFSGILFILAAPSTIIYKTSQAVISRGIILEETSYSNTHLYDGIDTDLGSVFAWLCAILYFTSRIPQIWKNYSRKSFEGLSIFMFLFAVLGNLSYTLSIILRSSTSSENFLAALPYMVGSGGTIIFDSIIFLQWRYYCPTYQQHRDISDLDDYDEEGQYLAT